MSFVLCFGVGTSCAPPPPVELTAEGPVTPTIEILYPEPGQQLTLDLDCVLTEPIVVDVEGIELTPPNGEPDPAEGHWHGGPSLTEGYCSSSVAFCEGAPSGSGTRSTTGVASGPGP